MLQRRGIWEQSLISSLVLMIILIICAGIHFYLRNICRIRHLLSHHATAQLIHALISTRLDYCNSVLYNLPTSSILRLQKIQTQAARILTRTPCRDHITEVLIDLHWLKIKERIVYTILILTFHVFVDRTAHCICVN